MNKRRVISALYFTIFFSVVTIFNSCSDDSNPSAPPLNTAQLIKLDSAYAIGGRATVSIYLEDSLKTGYNPVYIVLYDSVTNALISDAHIEFHLLNHGHAAPVENPSEEAVDGKFKGAFILTSPQTGDNVLHWHYTIMVHNHQAPGKPEGEAEFSDFLVRDNPDKFKSIIMPDSTKLFLSYISPQTSVTGANAFEFLINRNEPELFPPDGSYTVQMIPEYLLNGHTTANNINPAGQSDGHYKGTVNFDISGNWRIKLKIIKNTMSYDTYFDLSY